MLVLALTFATFGSSVPCRAQTPMSSTFIDGSDVAYTVIFGFLNDAMIVVGIMLVPALLVLGIAMEVLRSMPVGGAGVDLQRRARRLDNVETILACAAACSQVGGYFPVVVGGIGLVLAYGCAVGQQPFALTATLVLCSAPLLAPAFIHPKLDRYGTPLLPHQEETMWEFVDTVMRRYHVGHIHELRYVAGNAVQLVQYSGAGSQRQNRVVLLGRDILTTMSVDDFEASLAYAAHVWKRQRKPLLASWRNRSLAVTAHLRNVQWLLHGGWLAYRLLLACWRPILHRWDALVAAEARMAVAQEYGEAAAATIEMALREGYDADRSVMEEGKRLSASVSTTLMQRPVDTYDAIIDADHIGTAA